MHSNHSAENRRFFAGIPIKGLRKSLHLWLSVFIFAGCTNMCTPRHKDMTAEEVVEKYLDIAFNIQYVDQVKALISLTSGNLKESLEEADAQTVQRVFIDKKYALKRFSITQRRDRTPREVEITYELAYNELNEGSASDADVLTEKTLSLVKKDGAWYVADVIGGKTAIDFQIGAEIKP